MKVILLKDVRGVGKKYDIKEVSDGYGNNFLLPNKLAKTATPQAIAQIETIKAADAEILKVHTDLIEKNLSSIEGKLVPIMQKANDQGHLFASLHAKDIADAVKRATEVDIDPSWILLDKPIKTTGEHRVVVAPKDIPKRASFMLLVK